MNGVLLDTHAWIWSLMDSARLGESVKAAILEARARIGARPAAPAESSVA